MAPPPTSAANREISKGPSTACTPQAPSPVAAEGNMRPMPVSRGLTPGSLRHGTAPSESL